MSTRQALSLLLLLVSHLAGRPALAQAPAWQQAISNTNQPSMGTSKASATAVNAAGEVLLTGSFTGQVTFGTTRLVSVGAADIFVAKWRPATNTWAWAISAGGPLDDEAYGIALSGNNVYLTGYFSSTFTNNARIAGTTLPGVGLRDMFVAKYTDTGSSATNGWAVSGGSTGLDDGFGVAVSGTNVYVTGSCGGNARIAGLVLTSAGSYDTFVAKYTDAGTSAVNGWALTAGGSGPDEGGAIAVNGSSVYVAGDFTTATNVTIAGTALAGAGSTDSFLAKYIDAGSSATNGWAVSGGGTAIDAISGLAVSGSNLYVTGFFASATGARIAGTSLPGAGNYDLFVAKYTDGGGAVTGAWATSGGGTGSDYGSGIAVSGTQLCVTGAFTTNGAARIAGVTLTGAGSQDAFVAAYTDAGTSSVNNWANRSGGTGVDAGTGVAVSSGTVYAAMSTGTDIANIGSSTTLLVPASGAALGTLAGTTGSAQRVVFPQQGGGSFATATATDAAGNVYVTGAFTGQVAFGNYMLVSAGDSDLFVAKWNATTNTWAWATSSGSGSHESGSGIAVSGNVVYVAGDFGGSGTQAGTRFVIGSTTLTSSGDGDVFVAKYIDNGTSVGNGWAVSGGGFGGEAVKGLAVNGSNIYVTGFFNSARSLRIAGATLTGAGGQEVFLAKYMDAGNSASNGWAVRAGGTGDEYPYGIAASGTAVYITGYFPSGTGAVLAGTSLPGAGSYDIFLAKYTDNGTSFANGWAVSAGGASTDIGLDLAVSGTSVYLAGVFSNSSNVVIAGVTLPSTVSNGFVAKYTDNGASTTGVWATSTGSNGNNAPVAAIAVRGADIYVTGQYASASGVVVAGTALAGAGAVDVFVAKYTDNGTSFSNGWAASAGSSSYDGVADIALGSSIYVVGGTERAINFGGLMLSNPAQQGTYYLGQLGNIGLGLATVVGNPKVAGQLYPNPAHAAVSLVGGPPLAPLVVLDAVGRIVLKARTNAAGAAQLTLPVGLASGLYLVRTGTQVQHLVVE